MGVLGRSRYLFPRHGEIELDLQPFVSKQQEPSAIAYELLGLFESKPYRLAIVHPTVSALLFSHKCLAHPNLAWNEGFDAVEKDRENWKLLPLRVT